MPTTKNWISWPLREGCCCLPGRHNSWILTSCFVCALEEHGDMGLKRTLELVIREYPSWVTFSCGDLFRHAI